MNIEKINSSARSSAIKNREIHPWQEDNDLVYKEFLIMSTATQYNSQNRIINVQFNEHNQTFFFKCTTDFQAVDTSKSKC